MKEKFNHIPVVPPRLIQKTEGSFRTYSLEGTDIFYPSVTTVLSVTNEEWLKKWKKQIGEEKAEKIRKAAEIRGTHIHGLCEEYMNNRKPKPHMFYMDMWNALKREVNKIDNIRLLEKALYSEKLQVAGTPDTIGDYDGVLSVIDFKTSTKRKRKHWITNYFIQCAVGAVMFEERFGIPVNDIVVIIATEHETEAMIFKEKTERYVPKFKIIREMFRQKYNI